MPHPHVRVLSAARKGHAFLPKDPSCSDLQPLHLGRQYDQVTGNDLQVRMGYRRRGLPSPDVVNATLFSLPSFTAFLLLAGRQEPIRLWLYL